MPIPRSDPIVVAPTPTPFDDRDQVDHGAIERNVGRWLQTDLSGFVLNSENGEESFLSADERLAIVRTVKRTAGDQRLLIGGVDQPGVTQTLETIEQLAAAGVDLVRVRIPRLTDDVRGYFEQVIPRSARPVVIIHQMAPGRFLQAAASPGAAAEMLADWIAMDNVFGYITSDNLRYEARVRTRVPPGKRFWAANGSILLSTAVIGADGACLMLGNVLPQACRRILQHVAAGELQQAAQIHQRIVEADWQILSRGAAGVKAALELLGYETGDPRAPTRPCDEAAREQIRAALAAATPTHG